MVRTTLPKYAQVWRQRTANWRKNASKSSIELAQMLKNEIKLRAPKESGNLIRSIKRVKNRVTAGGTDPESGFPYFHWVNQSRGFRTLRYPRGAWIPASKSWNGKGTQILPPGSSAVYGSQPAGWNWTGQAGYITKSVIAVRKKAKRVVSKAFRDAMELHVTG